MEFVYFIPYFVPLAIIFIGAEIYVSVRHNEHLYEWKDSWASAFVGIGAVIVQALTKAGILAVFAIVYRLFEPLRLQIGYEGLGWAWWVWALAIIGDDFSFYWHHRLSHTVRILWAAHIVHHSSSYFNLGTSFRNGWIIFFYKPVFWLWMPALGFHPVMVLTAMAINSLYQFWLHTKKIPSLGKIEKFINTPYLHQIHHSQNPEYLDKNHSGIFIIWDRIFGTYHPGHTARQKVFGVTTPPGSYSPFKIITHEYENIWRDVKNAPGFKDKLKYIFYPPGWSHNGSTLTVKQMKRLKATAKNDNSMQRKTPKPPARVYETSQ